MTNVELYINNQLCDIRDPQNLGIRLNRVLLNPAELSVKDAQYSYSITIPSSPINDAIFSYINVEETKNKFNHNHTAQVYVDSVLVFDGRFKLSEIDQDGNFKGNLVVPTSKTVKEIFGEIKMNELAEWKFDLVKDGSLVGMPMGMIEMLNTINSREGIPDAIMPLVLYGLLPKKATTNKDGEESYSAKDVWDDTVQLGVEDFPPSINSLAAIKHIFETSKDENGDNYQISGTAFNDPKLTNLYMSYSNPTDYEQPWNWAHLGKMKITGSWKAANWNNGGKFSDFETQFYQTETKLTDGNSTDVTRTSEYVAVNLLSAKNADIEVIDDNGYNIYQYQTKKNNTTINNTSIVIPVSGYYKVTLDAWMELIGSDHDSGTSNKDLGLRFVYANENDRKEIVDGLNVGVNLFHSIRGELKVLRTRHEYIDMSEQVIDGVFYKKNFKQINDFISIKEETTNFEKFGSYPKYFPQEDSVLWVDPYQNKQFVCGLQWGRSRNVKDRSPVETRITPAYVMAAKSGISWSADNDDVNYCVTNSSGYWTYKPIKETNSETVSDEDDIDPKSLGYVRENKLKMDVVQKEDNIISREYTKGNIGEKGSGIVSVIVWLEKGEQLAVVDITDKGDRFKGWASRDPTYVVHQSEFTLTIEPYKKSQDWARINMDGTGAGSMSWYEDSNFTENYIDLTKFLPSEQKVDEWIENFCKAFNLDLLQPEAGKFQLNTKNRSYITAAGSVLDLSDKVDLRGRNNQPLGLPSEISATFKVNKEEEGYDFQTRKDPNNPDKEIPKVPDDGSGKLLTGSIDGKLLAQSSSFSYCWYKNIDCKYFFKDISGERYNISFPIISNKEVWEQADDRKDYAEMQKKTYTNYPQRFWYRGTTQYDMGALWADRYLESWQSDKNGNFHLYPVVDNSSNITGSDYLNLTYKDEPNSILRSYFTLISTDDSNYTEVECFLTPDEYEQLSMGILVSLNSDLYYVGSIDGYDPLGKNKTKLKLIRKV